MSDLRAPGNPGGTKGKSLPQQNTEPLEGNGSTPSSGLGNRPVSGPQATVPGKKGNPVH